MVITEPSVSQYQFLPLRVILQPFAAIRSLQNLTTSVSVSLRLRRIRSAPIGVVWTLSRFFSITSGLAQFLLLTASILGVGAMFASQKISLQKKLQQMTVKEEKEEEQ